MFLVLQKKTGLAATPLALLFLKLPFSIQNAFYRFLSSYIASLQKIFTHPDFSVPIRGYPSPFYPIRLESAISLSDLIRNPSSGISA
ncbi:hypothetical protein RIR_jg26076.t1 [Rhizophagus irregularis DAOM 181602=DAOM 197198]|uniref:Uncharacterized protein n=1 Tax=Rhizophagus irregularis (strain DAOM 197198w) TaxID=1432141 RepID=A0A015JGN2_RHIIW|nr:hypothetical protein RirG_125480 [Rhizophagus irregularis DAOM 197198w]GBC51406.1 hypothetical protein RIR_jg26076.t1 [Rhizophagus irregularis DAOM 181602=DAOM 197198]